MKKLVFDIETKNTFREVGKNDPSALEISVLVTYDYDTDTYTSYMEKDLPELWKVIEHTDLLIGYNSDHFDIPLLNKYYAGDLTKIKSLDLLAEIYKSIGRRLRLDDIANATLGMNKSASGLDAIRWWKEGKIDLITEYCTQDVKVTKEVYDYAFKNKKLKYKDLATIKNILLDTSNWEIKQENTMNLTLGL